MSIAASTQPDDVDWENGKITDAGLAEMQAHIGRKEPVPAWNRTVTEDTIWHFASGVGDDNPLWWDEAYAANSVHGGMVAPPAYLYSHTSGPRITPAQGQSAVERFLPGVLGLWAGERWVWHRPVRVGERISAESALVQADLSEGGSFGGRSVTQTERIELKTADGELVAEIFHTIKRFERAAARDRSVYLDRPLGRYTEEDRNRFDAQYEAEVAQRRGAELRYIEDVAVGETLPPMLKGPLTVSVLVGFLMGWGSPLAPTNRLLSQQLKAHPSIKMVHPERGIAENFNAAHLDGAFARMSGLPDAYDYGCQRVCWLAHMLGDWMGDHGFLVELDSRIRRPNIMGDISWLAGEIVAVDVEQGLATVKLSITNQLGEVNTTGVGKVRLPRRESRA